MNPINGVFNFFHEFISQIEEQIQEGKQIYTIYADGYEMFLNHLINNYPQFVIKGGISEQNMISMAIGLALSGKKVFVFIPAFTLLARAYDQLKCACYCNANITFVSIDNTTTGKRGGFGHIIPEDLALLKNMPNLNTYFPTTLEETYITFEKIFSASTPTFLGNDWSYYPYQQIAVHGDFSIIYQAITQKSCIIIPGNDIDTFMKNNILQKFFNNNIEPTVITINKIFPFNEDEFLALIKPYKKVISFETRTAGGLSSIIAELFITKKIKKSLLPIYYKGSFTNVGMKYFCMQKYFNDNSIIESMINFLKDQVFLMRTKITCKTFLGQRIKIKYYFLGIPVIKYIKEDNKLHKYLFGIIKLC